MIDVAEVISSPKYYQYAIPCLVEAHLQAEQLREFDEDYQAKTSRELNLNIACGGKCSCRMFRDQQAESKSGFQYSTVLLFNTLHPENGIIIHV